MSSEPRPWYALSADAALTGLGASADGLSSDEARARLGSHGPNRLPEQARRSRLRRFLHHFHNLLIYVLLGCAAITLILEHVLDTLVILAVVIANAIIGYVQEGKAEQAMGAIRKLLAPRAVVLRDGERRSVDAAELVPGDIVLLEAGEKVPADLRLLDAAGLSIQEAALTGESVPVEKATDPVTEGVPVGDRASMAFSGTLVTSGTARGVVVATGTATEIGLISGLLATVEPLSTPLVRQMDVFARWLTLVILSVAAALLVYGYVLDRYEFAEIFMAVVGLSVAAIPEGLPAVLTITLAVGVQAMARRNAIVRRLPAIETLGSVSVICTDKTGTLTRNEMLVASVVTAAGAYTIEGDGYAPHGEVKAEGETAGREDAALGQVAAVAALCNDAALRDSAGVWHVEGDPMEGALLAVAAKLGLDHAAAANGWARVAVIPFDARHRYMATLNRAAGGAELIAVKGAPEALLSMCHDQLGADGAAASLDPDYWHGRASAIAAHGQRVLALAVRSAAPEAAALEPADLEGRLTIVGLLGLIDPPRPEAIEAIAECRRAGIGVKMITGDHRGTAAAIGREIGLEHPDRVLTGSDLEAMDDAALAAKVLETDVFARTSPEHKLRLVQALQAHGMTVAMTGDGVNDAPALKRADAGIAMGVTGSEAAKEAAEIVLADDNFASIVAAVREGRTVYDNIKKVISWTLPTSVGEAITIVVALLFGMTLPVTPIQILWINLITVATLGVALAFEPTEASTMSRPPRPRDEPLLGGELAWHIVLVSVLFLGGVFGLFNYAIANGHSLELARTLVVNGLVVMEIFHLFFIRNIYGTSLTWRAVRGTRVVWTTVLIVTFAQLAITYVAPLQAVFATEPVGFGDGALVIGTGLVLFAIIEIEKQIRLRLRRSD